MPNVGAKRLGWLLLPIVVVLLVARHAGAWLVVDFPQPADAIVVLAGETEQRPAKGLLLLSQGLAPRMLLDVPAGSRIYRWTQMELAQQFLNGLPSAQQLSSCPIVGLSTRDEARDVAGCLAGQTATGAQVHRVLLVTSDFHTRRALAIFRHEIPGVQFSAAAAYDSAQYGPRWWLHRQWAKTFFDECVRLTWWYAVDCWRS
jgi:DUF218 domain